MKGGTARLWAFQVPCVLDSLFSKQGTKNGPLMVHPRNFSDVHSRSVNNVLRYRGWMNNAQSQIALCSRLFSTLMQRAAIMSSWDEAENMGI